MFHFFRQLRRKLLSNSQLSRYLFYALGEIVLVVLGILIALQIDNWNDQRKLQARQATLLTDLRSDLQETLDGLQFGKSLNAHTVVQYRFLMDAIDQNAPYSEQIDSAMAWLPMFHVPRFTRTAYESLKSQGVDILTNRTLKNQIANLYENEFPYLKEDQTQLEWSLHNTDKPVYINRYLRYRDNGDIMVFPVDFEKIKADTGFINFLATLIAIRAAGIEFYERTMAKTEEVIAGIDRELDNLE
ncbi:DUF6090 family protein [Robiginitalea marina]|uniref:DUF6090 family protein n=1 Tax=Robiginitalea marina TaxID=2954105 RepID=A0ABT1B0N4_9FLAO|nr:DUF6090 family protein [Robiginitalea marina]MCO5725853.1 DUF6090 family protein [Robiginitalea marina]